MLPAASFDDILRRSEELEAAEDSLGQRLISLIFAPPASPVWRGLTKNRAFPDVCSGESWDLFCRHVEICSYGAWCHSPQQSSP